MFKLVALLVRTFNIVVRGGAVSFGNHLVFVWRKVFVRLVVPFLDFLAGLATRSAIISFLVFLFFFTTFTTFSVGVSPGS
jgi:hypothetical protein